MLHVPDIAADRERIITGLRKKGLSDAEDLLNRVLELDSERKQLQSRMDNALAMSKKMSREIGAMIQAGLVEQAEDTKKETARYKEEARTYQDKLRASTEALNTLLYTIPNAAHNDVPDGSTAVDNAVVLSKGDTPNLPAGALPHWDLVKQYDIIDFELGNKITGAGFPVYKGKGARLQRALIAFFLDEAVKAGYTEIQPPVLVNADSGYGTGQLPDKEGQMYGITDSDLYLIPTAEVPLTNIYRDTMLGENDLPVKLAGYSLCFRREAGSWGTHVRGLNRLHQFDKVEIVQIRKPEESYSALEEMSDHVCGLLGKLELPFRKVLLCGGDMGFTAAKTYDMEVYSAAQQQWLEVSSVSNFESYQSNRLKLRYKSAGGSTQLLHTLNGSALALPRVLAALLENNQERDAIRIPSVLQPYTGFDVISG
jgi:seryl-tRNA synthetase